MKQFLEVSLAVHVRKRDVSAVRIDRHQFVTNPNTPYVIVFELVSGKCVTLEGFESFEAADKRRREEFLPELEADP